MPQFLIQILLVFPSTPILLVIKWESFLIPACTVGYFPWIFFKTVSSTFIGKERLLKNPLPWFGQSPKFQLLRMLNPPSVC